MLVFVFVLVLVLVLVLVFFDCHVYMRAGKDAELLFQLCKTLHNLREEPMCVAMHIWRQLSVTDGHTLMKRIITKGNTFFNRLSMSTQVNVADIMMKMGYISQAGGSAFILVCAARVGDLMILNHHINNNTKAISLALLCAIRHNHIAAVSILLKAGGLIHRGFINYICDYTQDDMVFVICRNSQQQYLLRFLLYYACEVGRTSVVRYLLKAGLIANPIYLSIACSEGHADVVKLLLKAGIIAQQHDLQKAIIRGHSKVVKVLHNAGF